VKDIIATADAPTFCNILITGDGWARGIDAPVVARLRGAGAVIVGKSKWNWAMLRQQEFAFINALNFLHGMCIVGMMGFVPLDSQESYGFTATQACLLLTPRALAMVGTSVLAGMLLHRTGFRSLIRFGMLVLAVSAGLLGGGHAVGARRGPVRAGLPHHRGALLGIGCVSRGRRSTSPGWICSRSRWPRSPACGVCSGPSGAP
jgi:hypothetical protein